MKMANAKKCDGCGKLYENNQYDYDRIQHFHIVKEYHNGECITYDLCDDCYHELLKFLHEDGEKNGHH